MLYACYTKKVTIWNNFKTDSLFTIVAELISSRNLGQGVRSYGTLSYLVYRVAGKDVSEPDGAQRDEAEVEPERTNFELHFVSVEFSRLRPLAPTPPA